MERSLIQLRILQRMKRKSKPDIDVKRKGINF